MRSNIGSESAQGFVPGLNDGTLGLLAAAILLVSAVVWSAHGPNVERTDFALTYVGAKLVHEGFGPKLYDIALQKKARDSLFKRPSPLFFEHPPFEALLLSPLAGHPFRIAYMIWGFANAAIGLVLMIVLRSLLRWPREDLGYIGLWLLFAPLEVAIYQGQSSVILLGVYAFAFLELQCQREFRAGLMLGFGLLKFQFVLPFMLIFLFLKKWRLLAGFAVTSALLGLLSVVAVGWQGVADYVRFLLTIGSKPENVSYGSGVDMPTIHGLVFAILGRWLRPTGLAVLVAFLSLLLLAWIAWRWHTQGRSSFNLMFSASVAASLLTGSHMFTHDFSPLLLAMFLAAAQLSAVQPLLLRWTMAATVVIFWTFPIYFLCVAWHCLYLMCPILLLFTYAAVGAAQHAMQASSAEAEYVEAG
jgi:hypothetical protein